MNNTFILPISKKYLRGLNISFLGGPCSGKSFTAEILAAQEWARDEDGPTMAIKDMGAIMRGRSSANPEGFAPLHTGGLVSSDIFLDVVDAEVTSAKKNNQGIIFTGQPRKLAEAQYFFEHHYIDIVFYLSIAEETMRQRMMARILDTKRADDEIEKFEQRLLEWQRHALSVMDFFLNHNVPIYTINANNPDRSRIDNEINSLLYRHFLSWNCDQISKKPEAS